MSLAVLAILFGASAVVTLLYGSTRAFVWVFLPALMFVFKVIPKGLPLGFSLDQVSTCMYGMMLGVALRGGEPVRFKFNALDLTFLAMAAMKVMTTIVTIRLWTAMSATAGEVVYWLLPYYFGRQLFADLQARRQAFWVLGWSCVVIAAISLIEVRLSPYFYSRLLEYRGIIKSSNNFVYHRFGLFRAMMGFSHPIDYGNVGLAVAALIAIFGVTSGRRFNDWYVRLFLAASLGIVVLSLSFTCLVALAFGVGLAMMLWSVPQLHRTLVPGVLIAVGGVVVTSAIMLSWNLDNYVAPEGTVASFSASLVQRAHILQDTWKVASGAGVFGYGRLNLGAVVDIPSIDNSYLLFLLRFGWAYLLCWLWMAIVFARDASAALGSVQTPEHRVPLVAATAGIAAILVGMYTVFFDSGFAYAVLTPILAGVSNTMFQTISGARSVRMARPMGFAAAGSTWARGT